MKFTVAAAAAIALAIAATTASAGVVITQKLGSKDPSGERKTERTVMVQGNKQKVISEDRQFIIDLDAGQLTIIRPAIKQFIRGTFPPNGMFSTVIAQDLVPEGSKKTGDTHKQNGYTCQGYLGSTTINYTNYNVIECVASGAPGAKEYVAFQRLMAQKLKGSLLAPAGEIPDGIPVSSITTMGQIAIAMTGGISPEYMAKLQADLDKHKTVTGMNVSKIEVKELPAATFAVPAGYTEAAMPGTQIGTSGTGAPKAPAGPAPH
jgi:hypothetical protein